MTTEAATLVKAFLALQIIGQAGLVVLLATVTFSSLPRLPTLSGMIITWIFSVTAACLLLYAGEALPDASQPSFTLCLLQAAFVNGSSILTALSSFTLIFEGWLAVTGKVGEAPLRGWRVRTAVLLGVPWFGFLITAISTFVVGYEKSAHVSRDGRLFFCSVSSPGLNTTITVANVLFLFITGVYALKATMVVHAVWTQFSTETTAVATNAPRLRLGMAVRLSVFGVYVVLDLIFCILGAVMPMSRIPPLFFSTNPLVMFLIFGTQSDLVHIWISPFMMVFNMRLSAQDRTIESPLPIAHQSYEKHRSTSFDSFESRGTNGNAGRYIRPRADGMV